MFNLILKIRIKLYMTLNLKNGDCLELMKELPDKSIDLFICDLPYGETNCKWDCVIDLDEFWKEFKRLRKSKRTACIHFCSTKFGYTLIKSNEKMFKMDMVWKKRNKTGGLQSRHRPMRNHEMVYFFYEQAPKYNRDKYHKRIQAKNPIVKEEKPNPASVLEEKYNSSGYKKELVDGVKNFGTYGFEPPNPASVVEEFIEPTEDEPKSMFESQKVFIGKRHHQTEKPLDILEFFLKYWSDEGDTILDPTMGSGSTGVACKKLKRNFIGMEMNDKIFKVAEDRCK
tara:strand:- start:3188 stop:4039 length:852 start_codon:yes stop_codon:yes gene_type:complete